MMMWWWNCSLCVYGLASAGVSCFTACANLGILTKINIDQLLCDAILFPSNMYLQCIFHYHLFRALRARSRPQGVCLSRSVLLGLSLSRSVCLFRSVCLGRSVGLSVCPSVRPSVCLSRSGRTHGRTHSDIGFQLAQFPS